MNKKNGLLIMMIYAGLYFLAACTLTRLETTPPETVTLRFAFLGDDIDYESLAGIFESQESGITMELDQLTLGPQLQPQFQQALTTADVVRLSSIYLSPEIIENFQDLAPLIAADPNFPGDDFLPGAMMGLQIDGKQIGLPAGISPMVVFVEGLRFTLAKEPMLPVEYSLDDLVASAKAIHNPDPGEKESGMYAFGICTSPTMNDILIISQLFGGGLFDNPQNPTRPTFNRPENVEAVKWYASLWGDDPVAPDLNESISQVYVHIRGSQCAYWMGNYYTLGNIAESTVDLHLLPLPMVKRNVQSGIVDGYYLTRSSEHPEAAWKWMRFLIDYQEAAGKKIPARMSQIEDKKYQARISEDLAEIIHRMADSTELMPLSLILDDRAEQAANIFLAAVHRVARGEQTAEAALEEAQRQAEEIYK